MTISGGSALSKDDIDRMVKEAEQYAEEDAKRREAVETRNQADQLVYTTEKFLADNAEKLPEDVKTEVQADVDALKAILENAEAVRRRAQGRRHQAQRVQPEDGRRDVRRRRGRRRPPPVAPTARPARPTTTSSTPRSSTRSPTAPRARPSDRAVPATSTASRRLRSRRPLLLSPRRAGRGAEMANETEVEATTEPRAARPRSRWPSGPPTCSACRRSSSTTSAASSGTAT